MPTLWLGLANTFPAHTCAGLMWSKVVTGNRMWRSLTKPCARVTRQSQFPHSPCRYRYAAKGGAAHFLDGFQLIEPRLSRYSMGLREPNDILIRFSLYQRMYSCTARMNNSMVVDFQSCG
jgi:hypothetical protein